MFVQTFPSPLKSKLSIEGRRKSRRYYKQSPLDRHRLREQAFVRRRFARWEIGTTCATNWCVLRVLAFRSYSLSFPPLPPQPRYFFSFSGRRSRSKGCLSRRARVSNPSTAHLFPRTHVEDISDDTRAHAVRPSQTESLMNPGDRWMAFLHPAQDSIESFYEQAWLRQLWEVVVKMILNEIFIRRIPPEFLSFDCISLTRKIEDLFGFLGIFEEEDFLKFAKEGRKGNNRRCCESDETQDLQILLHYFIFEVVLYY